MISLTKKAGVTSILYFITMVMTDVIMEAIARPDPNSVADAM
jgi:hypothetical protein